MAEKVIKSNSDLLTLVSNLNATHAEKGSKREAKLKKIATKIKPLFEEYNEKREEIRLDHAYADEKGVLHFNEKGEYKFTKEGIKTMNAEMKKLLEKTFEFYQFVFTTEGIDDLKYLAGWVEGIEPDKEQDDEQI